ncbi:MAG: universal stress protein [Anaerolineae bacterium]|nr:universal stress protein [Anaerolineae bacterium]
MAMYRTILVPLDGSERAEAILPHVEELARRYHAEVVLLQVIEPAYNIPTIPATGIDFSQEIFEGWVTEAKAYLAGVESRLQEKGIEVRTRVESGPVVEAIIHVASNVQADLIAMASHGRTGMSRVFYGSVAAGILHRIDRPLLLIRS